jgi:CubicO group peptidase (beta-lactamase class C family)
MRLEAFLKTTLIVFLICTQASYSQTKLDSTKSEFISQALSEIVNDGKAPGMIAAIISSEGIEAIASAGVRKYGSAIEFSISDKVHLGSCGKAMTCAMIATLVAEGKINWETKLLEILPELKGEIHPNYYSITLWDLLNHRAGFPDLWTHNQRLSKEKRLSTLKKELKSPTNYEVGSFHYSNLGYISAACMVEKITGKYWEELMQERLFKPLGMTSAGFGNPGKPGKINQPWGHRKTWKGWNPVYSDCSEVLGPAGRIHCNIEDWAKFLSLQLTKSHPILDSTILNKLRVPGGFYAGGWGVTEYDWAKGKILTHCGSNEIWFSNVVVAPNLNKAYIVVTNSRDFGVTKDLCTEMTNKIIIMDLETNK